MCQHIFTAEIVKTAVESLELKHSSRVEQHVKKELCISVRFNVVFFI